MLQSDLAAIQADALAAIAATTDERSLDNARVQFLGKSGRLTQASSVMRDLPKEEKPAAGQLLNETRQAITSALDEKKVALIAAADALAIADLDLTLPGRSLPVGALHPLTAMQDRVTKIFRQLGFALATGPEVETEWHCFDALNTPADHPARNESDTFYFDSGKLLRTHTSSVQVRTMEGNKPPVRIIAPGSAYRRDEIDATHLSVFTQIEGLYVAGGVTLPDLKGTLEFFFKALYGESTEVRFRPHFFPFTEPSFEIDVKLEATGKQAKWIEIAGCGMVDPAVFDAVNKERGDDAYDPSIVTGFAFGMGLERLTMIEYGISDIRHLIENDQRFLKQFA